MSTETLSAREQLIEFVLTHSHDEPEKYIALASGIMALAEKEHPEEKYSIRKMVFNFIEEFTEQQFIDALKLTENIKQDILSDRKDCSGLSKENLCDFYDTIIFFIRHHFIDD